MLYRSLADLVALTHLGFILFVLFGGLLAFRWRRVPWVHIPAVVWAAAVEFFGWFCPLTPLENSLRHAGGSDGYSGGFVEGYIMPIIYPAELTRELQILLGCGVLFLSLAIYFALWRRRRG
jgi:hypothetical protein